MIIETGANLELTKDLSWTYDLCANAIVALTARPEADWPCEEPPCADGAGTVWWRAGRAEPMTVRPGRLGGFRFRSMPDEEPCGFDVGGGFVMAPNGRVQPIMCNEPDRGPEYAPPISYPVGYGIRSEQDGSGVIPPGRVGFVVAYQTPPVVVYRYDSEWFLCIPGED